MNRRVRFGGFLFSVVLLCCGRLKVFDHAFFSMDTFTRIKVVCHGSQRAQEIADLVETEAKRLHRLLSAYEQQSEVYRLNHRKSSVRTMNIDPEAARLVAASLDIAAETRAAFDPTIGPVKWLWGFGSGMTPKVPSKKALDSVLELVGFEEVVVDTQANELCFNKPGAQIDLGGISKGYAVQCFADIIQSKGIHNFLIEAGGDVFASGAKPDGKAWVVGLRHPRKSGLLTAFAAEHGQAIVTSGDYERFFENDGKRFHHIFDPRTGYPSTDCVSVTIVADDPVWADAVSTAVFVMGPRKGLDFIIQHQGTEGIIVTENEKGELDYFVSGGLVGKVVLGEL